MRKVCARACRATQRHVSVLACAMCRCEMTRCAMCADIGRNSSVQVLCTLAGGKRAVRAWALRGRQQRAPCVPECRCVAVQSLGAPLFPPCRPVFSADPRPVLRYWFADCSHVISGPISSTFDILRVCNAKHTWGWCLYRVSKCNICQSVFPTVGCTRPQVQRTYV